MEARGKGCLGFCRALDLADEKGFLAGKILGDLGADVIKIEPPSGDPARNIGPFYHDIPDPEKSLYWFAFNANKRGITLNIETIDGQELLKKLVKTADVLIESFPPSYMVGVGLGYSVLSKINPRIVMTSITPFGSSGPYCNYKGSDAILMALGGLTYISGNPDHPPVRISSPQAYLHSGAYAAVGSMMALYHQQMCGKGQQVDVSIQECCEWASYFTPEWWDMQKVVFKRQGMWRNFGPTRLRTVYPCKDGYVSCWILAGPVGGRGRKALVKWMDNEGMSDDWLNQFDFDAWDAATTTQEICNRIAETVGRFLLTKTKDELFDFARRVDLFLAPFNSVKDLRENPHSKARGFWAELHHPELGSTINYPGQFIRLSESPITINRRAPLIGEHNKEIYQGELGLTSEDLVRLKEAGAI